MKMRMLAGVACAALTILAVPVSAATNPEMPAQWTISLGASAEKLAGMYEISRQAQDEFALRSHQRAQSAWDGGFYERWVAGYLAESGWVRAAARGEALSLEASDSLVQAFREALEEHLAVEGVDGKGRLEPVGPDALRPQVDRHLHPWLLGCEADQFRNL